MNKGFLKHFVKTAYSLKTEIALQNFVPHFTLFHFVKAEFVKIPQCLRKHSVNIVRMCTQQCECVVAHRVRRGQQIVSLYSRLWDEMALRAMMSKMRQQIARRGKEILFSVVGAAAYNWETDRIPDEDILSLMKELELIHELVEKTLTCQDCHKRRLIDVPDPRILYCDCQRKGMCHNNSTSCVSGLSWEPFLEREDLLIWREDHDGQYAYKMYGSYDDVTAKDFFLAQIDPEYRQLWDKSVVNLRVVESDSSSNSDIIYWEMRWPRLFANRDYVYNRRYVIDCDRKIMIIVNRSTEHPACPETDDNHRVKEYWSYMIIKANTSFDEPGIEFALTYFDNSGSHIPSSVAAWVAVSGLPGFMARLRQAAKDFHELHRSKPLFDRDIKFHKEPSPRIPTTEKKSTPPSSSSKSPFHTSSFTDHRDDTTDHPYFSHLYGYRLFV